MEKEHLMIILKALHVFREYIESDEFVRMHEKLNLPHWKDLAKHAGDLQLNASLVVEGGMRLDEANPYRIALHPKTFAELRELAVETGELIPFPTGPELAVLLTSMHRMKVMVSK